MKHQTLIICAVSLASLAMVGSAAAKNQAVPPPPQASIPFANLGGIRNWHARDGRTLYIEDIHRNWYKAALFGYCPDLPFRERIGFTTDPSGSFDRFSTVYTRHDRCPVASLTRSASPFAVKKDSKSAS